MSRPFLGLSLAECLVLLTSTGISAFAAWFHEPWADEAQAYIIARDLGIPGILHQMGYEGSPPLWHLLLWVLVRLHLPYAALSIVSLTLVSGGMYVWLRWSPLPTPVRLLVPFTFYYQYQYAVVARSYALSTFLVFVAVVLWRSKPVRVIPLGLILALLAQTNMHGFMIAGGISCAFAWECIRDFRKQRPSQARILQTIVACVMVLVSAAIARTLATPFADCSFKAATQLKKETALESVVRGLGGIRELGIALGLNLTWGLGLLLLFIIWAIAVKKRAFLLPWIATLAVAGLVYLATKGNATVVGISEGVVLLILVLAWFLKVKRLACALPLIFTVLAMGLVWSRPWHFGMALTAFLVSVWAAWPAKDSPRLETSARLLAFSLTALLIIQLPFTAQTIRDEVQGAYSGSRATAEFLRPYVGRRPIYCINFYGMGVQAYYDQNIFANWPTAFWTWSNRMDWESKRILYETPPSNAIIVVPTGAKSSLKLAKSEIARVQLTKRHFLRKREFCGGQFWMGGVSEYECYEIYERQSR